MTGIRGGSLNEGAVSRVLPLLAFPMLYANVLTALTSSVNSIWVGRFLGEAALTATANANTVMFLLTAMASGLAVSTNVLVGRSLGVKDVHAAKRVVGTGAAFFVGSSLGLTLVGVVLSKPLLRVLGTPEEAVTLALPYLRTLFLALPFGYLYAFVISVLRDTGDTKTPLYFTLLCIAIDVGLNPVLIFGLGPHRSWE